MQWCGSRREYTQQFRWELWPVDGDINTRGGNRFPQRPSNGPATVTKQPPSQATNCPKFSPPASSVCGKKTYRFGNSCCEIRRTDIEVVWMLRNEATTQRPWWWWWCFAVPPTPLSKTPWPKRSAFRWHSPREGRIRSSCSPVRPPKVVPGRIYFSSLCRLGFGANN